MSNVYEVIDALRRSKGYSFRELAGRTGISHTTLASILTRRVPKISASTLEAIAKAFEIGVNDLLPNRTPIQGAGKHVLRYWAELTEEEAEQVLTNLIGENYEQFLSDEKINVVNDRPYTNRAEPATRATMSRHFRQTINFVLNKLNDDGLMEAMRRVLDVAQDPQYCISTTTLTKKEDDQCQENET